MARFNWISHTWTHQNLDWSTPDDCHGKVDSCRVPYQRIYDELKYNFMLAEGQSIPRNEYEGQLKYVLGSPLPEDPKTGCLFSFS